MPQSPRVTIPFVGQESRSRSFLVDTQQTRNFVTAVSSPGGKAPVTLESAPGVVELGAIGDGPVRTPKFVEWTHPVDRTKDSYSVFGTQVVRLSLAQGPVVIGTVSDNNTHIRIARGRTHLLFVDGNFGYTYDGTTFQTITDVDFPDATSNPAAQPTHAVYIDGFFVVNDARTDNFFISDIEDPDSWNALEFAAAAVAPDQALALAATESELWVIGDETAQAFYNSGNATFPYAIILSATQEVGIAAPQTIAESDAGIFYLATTPEGGLFVYRIFGHSGRRISGEEQDEQIAEVPDISCASGFIYQQEGKSFYCLQLHPEFPTLVYNINAQTWETRAMADGTAWRVGGVGVFNTGQKPEVVAGSRLGGILYTLRLDNYEDAGTPLIRRRVTAVQHSNNQQLDWWEVVVDTNVYDVPPNGAGSDPLLRLRYSDDGGVSWSDQITEPMGKQGEAFRRAVFRNLGQSRNRVFEVEISDPVGATIIGAYARVEVLDD